MSVQAKGRFVGNIYVNFLKQWLQVDILTMTIIFWWIMVKYDEKLSAPVMVYVHWTHNPFGKSFQLAIWASREINVKFFSPISTFASPK